MFKFSFDSIAESISQGTQQLVQQLNDPQTKLSIKAKTRFLQETIGSELDISKLPPQYIVLEKKCDSLEKSLKRVLLVTKTYELDGYDYPPNISESISDWWFNKDGWFGNEEERKKKEKLEQEAQDKESSDGLSFASAIAKAGHDSQHIFEAIETKDEDEKEDIGELVSIFKVWSECYSGIHKSKSEMDQLITKEFNQKLEKIVKDDFQKIHKLRAKVEDSRLKFDTMRYEVKKEEDKKAAKTANEKQDKAPTETATKDEAEPVPAKETPKDSTTKTEDSKTKTEDSTTKKEVEPSAEETPEVNQTSEDNKLLEQLEDEFVSNTTEAVEVMTEITDNTEIISLIKLFQNFQLAYHKHCVEEIESSIKDLNSLEQ